MSNSRLNLLAGDCARVWCSNNKVPFTCLVSPWLDSLQLHVDYKTVDRENAHKAHKEWVWFFGYSNGAATFWGSDMFINISDSSHDKGAVIVRVSHGKLEAYSNRAFYVFEGIKRTLRYATYSEIPHQSNSIESSSWYNYHIADDVNYQPEKCEGQLFDETLRGLMDEAIKTEELRRRMHGYDFHVPAIKGLLADLVDPLVS